MIQTNRIYNENCLEGMKKIPDGIVDAIICDLPYGTTACSWDSIIPFEALWEQYRRVKKKTVQLFYLERNLSQLPYVTVTYRSTNTIGIGKKIQLLGFYLPKRSRCVPLRPFLSLAEVRHVDQLEITKKAHQSLDWWATWVNTDYVYNRFK